MTDIYALTHSTLSTLGYSVREQGTYGKEETLPETFATYLVVDQVNRSHADNCPTSTTTRVQVAFYSTKPSLVQGADAAIKAVMIPGGFMRISGRNLPFDANTRHYGYICDYNFFDMEG